MKLDSSAHVLADLMRAALEHHEAGRFSQAESLYQQVVRLDPEHADALHHLGVIACQMGRNESAVTLMMRAINAKPSDPHFHSNLGLAYQSQGKLNDAVASYRQALSLKPDSVEAHYNLGNALLLQGRLDDAIASYHQAVLLRPDHADALNNLGVAFLRQGRLEDAVASQRQAISFKPDHADAHNNLGMALNLQDKADEAVISYVTALSLRPDHAEAHYNLGNVHLKRGKLESAIGSYRRALSIRADFAQAHYNLGNALTQRNELDEAVACYRQALLLSPNHAEAYNSLGFALQQQGRMDDAIACYRRAVSIKPAYVEAYSNLLLVLYSDPSASPVELMAACQGFTAQFEVPLKAEWQRHRNARNPDRRLKLGYVSADFRRHAVAYFIEPILANHARDEFEVFCYYNDSRRDAVTDRLAGYADHWLECKAVTDEQLAERIRSDGIDILIDLSGHTARNRILTFARKPAPIQITYLGYPGSSALTAVGYRLTDAHADPAGSDAFYTEKLLRLPEILWCYRPDEAMPEILALPAQGNAYITFGSFNKFSKISTSCIKCWAQLLRALPDSRLLMVGVPEGEPTKNLETCFAALGIPAHRLELHGRVPPFEFRSMVQRTDIALDSFPTTGGTTTCETLWMGVPVVTLAGARCVARMGLSVLKAVGLEELVAFTPEEYAMIAMRLATNRPRLAELRAGLRARVAASALMDGAKFTRNLERIYREVWAEWCTAAA
jgi:protein O-GlcNAc transferase